MVTAVARGETLQDRPRVTSLMCATPLSVSQAGTICQKTSPAGNVCAS